MQIAMFVFYFAIVLLAIYALVKVGVKRGWISEETIITPDPDEEELQRKAKIEAKRKELSKTARESNDLGTEISVTEGLIDKKEEVADKTGRLSELESKLGGDQ